MIILALIMGGLANLFVATKQIALHTGSRMVVGELARHFLDRLQKHVREDWWNDVNNPPDNPAPNCLLTVGN